MTPKTKNKLSWLPVFLVLFVVAVWIVFGWLLPASQNVDQFSAVNALFGGLAFVGLIFAILLQAEELSLQRKELELTRIELEGQKNQLQLQNLTLTKQNLENTFFNLLKAHVEIVAAIDLVDHNKRVMAKARDCFSSFYLKQLRRDYHDVNSDFPGMSEIVRVQRAYERFFARSQADVGHYFRSLYHVFKFIDSSEIQNKQFYANLVVAQLSSFELLVLFYNCLTSYGNENFKPLVERFGILENLDKSLLLSQSHLGFYEQSAFGEA